jgi:hypothetical protein
MEEGIITPWLESGALCCDARSHPLFLSGHKHSQAHEGFFGSIQGVDRENII